MPSKKTLKSITKSARRLSKRSKKIKCPPGKKLYLQCSNPCTNARNGRKRFRSLSGRCKSKPKGTHKYTDKEYDDLFNNAIRSRPLNYTQPQILRRSPRARR